MNQLETYSLLLSDSFFANLAIDTSTEFVIHTLKIFDNYEPIPVIIIATAGFFLASLVNYFFGKIVFKIVAPNDKVKHAAMIDRMDYIRQLRVLPLILLSSAVPFFGKFVVLFAGFCNIRFTYVISITTFAKLGYYTYLIVL